MRIILLSYDFINYYINLFSKTIHDRCLVPIFPLIRVDYISFNVIWWILVRKQRAQLRQQSFWILENFVFYFKFGTKTCHSRSQHSFSTPEVKGLISATSFPILLCIHLKKFSIEQKRYKYHIMHKNSFLRFLTNASNFASPIFSVFYQKRSCEAYLRPYSEPQGYEEFFSVNKSYLRSIV